MTSERQPDKVDPATRDRALLVLAACGGSPSRASKMLREEGIDISPQTLRAWRERKYAERYMELMQQHAPQIEAMMVTTLRESVLRGAQVYVGVVAELEQKLLSGELAEASPQQLARMLADLSRATAGSLDRMLTLTGRPQSITERRSIDELLRREDVRRWLAHYLGQQGTAEELPAGDAPLDAHGDAAVEGVDESEEAV